MIEIAGIRVNDFFRFVFGLYSVEKKKAQLLEGEMEWR